MAIFYKPGIARCSDIIPFFDDGHFKPFYLKRWPPHYSGNDAKPGWYMLTTDDFVHYAEHYTDIQGATGCVIKADGIYHMFYCVLTPESQTICHAVSPDLDKWQKIPEDTFEPDGVIYDKSDWRDAFVFWNEEESQWWMLACGSLKNSTTMRKGCIALCVSHDLHHWEFKEPFYAPNSHESGMECPDLFKIGDWYYLIYSCSTENLQTYYRMSKSINGPWIVPEVDTFDARPWYAGKTAFDGKNRYLFAWVAAKEFNSNGFNPPSCYGKDYGSWDHGGTLVVHKLLQNEDGTLSVACPETVAGAFSKEVPVEFEALTGEWKQEENSFSCSSQYSYGCALLNSIPETCRIEMDVTCDNSPKMFGAALQVDHEFVRGYYLEIEPYRSRIEWKSAMKMYNSGAWTFPYDVELERPVRIENGKKYHMSILIDKDMYVTYISGVVMTCRGFDYSGRRLGLFASFGNARFENVRIFTAD